MASSFESHFLGMLLMFIPALCELVIISIVAIGGGAYVPYLISTYLTNEDRDTLIVMIIVKVLYTLLFLWACVQLLSMFHITQYYYLLFSNSMFDQIMKMVNFLPLCHL